MQIHEITKTIEETAPLSLQEDYDNAGLLLGNPNDEARAALLCIDVSEETITEAISKKCNLIIAHHPLIFKGLKSITGKNEVERCVQKAIKNNIAIYAAHTNLDNAENGVSARMAEKIGLKNFTILQPQTGKLAKLATFVPKSHAETLRNAIFEAGGGCIGNYDMCSFNAVGEGSFRAKDGANPFAGSIGNLHFEDEVKIEVTFPIYLKNRILTSIIKSHPYEEPVVDFYALQNVYSKAGSGVVGTLEVDMDEKEFLLHLKKVFGTPVIKHSPFLGRKVRKIALCGGAGSFLTGQAIAAGADVFVTGDVKYHDFFQAENRLVIADVGHFESEQYTKEIFFEIIRKKFPTFAVHFSEEKNRINYL